MRAARTIGRPSDAPTAPPGAVTASGEQPALLHDSGCEVYASCVGRRGATGSSPAWAETASGFGERSE